MADHANFSGHGVAVDSVLVQEELQRCLISIRIEDHYDLSSLTDDDFQKIIFLLSPYLNEDDRSYVSNPNMTPERKMKYLILEVSKSLKNSRRAADLQVQSGRFIYELLYLIKRHRLLKLQRDSRICLHTARTDFHCNSENIVPRFWKSLFEICENLDDTETSFLRERLCEDDKSLKCAEHVMYHLFKTKKISRNNLQCLSSAFQACVRDDLKKMVEGMESYDIRSSLPGQKWGLAVIINQRTFTKRTPPGLIQYLERLDDRMGTDMDAARLSNLWESFGLEVLHRKDLTSQEIVQLVTIVERQQFSKNIFVCCILSHGFNGNILGSDRVAVPVKTIFDLFGNSKRFEGKPKLFFIQACQGDYEQQGIGNRIHPVRTMQHDGPTDNQTGSLPLQSDMLIGMSTIPGYVSYRSEENGSVYIYHLVKMIEEHWKTEHLSDIMTLVTRTVANADIDHSYKQMTNVVNRLRYKLYLEKSA